MTMGQTSADIGRELDALAAAGRVRLNDVGVVGALGLSVEPTRHELLVGDIARYTWCALDALGVLAALGATGTLSTTDPLSGRPLTVGFDAGEPTSGHLSGGIFLASLAPGTKVVDNWCPLVNLFENETNARQWAEQRGVTGEFVPVLEVTLEAGESWSARIGPPPRS
jgi:hypothetical protein